MPIPDYETIMLPLLKFAGDNKEHSIRETIDHIGNYFRLSESERKVLLPSGQDYIINNRVRWANFYLRKAGLLESTKRAYYKITEKGLEVLKQNPAEIDTNYLKQFPEFLEFITPRKEIESAEGNQRQLSKSLTPQELIEQGYQSLHNELSLDLLELVKKSTPRFFEKLVVELLLAMGYGGSRKDAGKAVGKSGDGGIDGIINEDKLGLDVIYIQAKRWENSVGSKEIRNFVGSLVGHKANKGVFITTSSYSKDALEYVKTINHKVILIDGDMLTQLMIENNIGVSKVQSYDIKKIDTDYFSEE
ncbi:MAG: restriction endonuclease [Thermodesulfobacteriota bacterium]